MSDRTSLLEEQRTELVDAMSLWKSLLDHRGWQEFVKVQLTQMSLRQQVVCTTPVSAIMGVLAQEFFKGEFKGVKEALEFPQARYDEAKREVALINQLLENESEIEKRISDSAKSRVDTSDHFGE